MPSLNSTQRRYLAANLGWLIPHRGTTVVDLEKSHKISAFDVASLLDPEGRSAAYPAENHLNERLEQLAEALNVSKASLYSLKHKAFVEKYNDAISATPQIQKRPARRATTQSHKPNTTAKSAKRTAAKKATEPAPANREPAREPEPPTVKADIRTQIRGIVDNPLVVEEDLARILGRWSQGVLSGA